MKKSICGIDCALCEFSKTCNGCVETNGRPFGAECVVASCCIEKGQEFCSECNSNSCTLKEKLIAEFNALGIEDMPEVTDLNSLVGSYINLDYTLPGGQKVKFWDDNKCYLGNQLCKRNSERCYGIIADENNLMVCEYGDGGSEAEIIIYKKRG